MKASNKWLIGLSIVFFATFLANIYYHKYNFERKRVTLASQALFRTQCDRIRVVMLTDSTGKAGNKMEVFRPKMRNSHSSTFSGGKDFEKTFWNSVSCSHDTLFVNLGTVVWCKSHDDKPHVRFSMQRLEKVYYNGRLQKKF